VIFYFIETMRTGGFTHDPPTKTSKAGLLNTKMVNLISTLNNGFF